MNKYSFFFLSLPKNEIFGKKIIKSTMKISLSCEFLKSLREKSTYTRNIDKGLYYTQRIYWKVMAQEF